MKPSEMAIEPGEAHAIPAATARSLRAKVTRR